MLVGCRRGTRLVKVWKKYVFHLESGVVRSCQGGWFVATLKTRHDGYVALWHYCGTVASVRGKEPLSSDGEDD